MAGPELRGKFVLFLTSGDVIQDCKRALKIFYLAVLIVLVCRNTVRHHLDLATLLSSARRLRLEPKSSVFGAFRVRTE